jgi:5-methylcytosine-specific restriction endonuclease McrA
MPTVDLFGNITPDKTWEEEYKEYISSRIWKEKCKQALERVGYKCQKCGLSKWARKLEVHHLTYERFKHELPEDLIVVCNKCHKIKDRQREQETEKRNYEKLQDARFVGWARKVYGDDWMLNDQEYIYLKYEAWLEKIGEY